MSALLVAGRITELALCAAAVAVLLRSRRPTNDAEPSGQDAAPADARSERTVAPAGRDVEAADVAIARVLTDVRDALGADEATFWRWTPRRDTLVRVAADPPEAGEGQGGALLPLATWAATERMPHVGGADSGLAIAPVDAGGAVIGALVLYRPGGFEADRDRVRRWLPRCAAHLGRYAALLETRDEFGRASMQRDALLLAATEFQQNRSLKSLGASICSTAVRVTASRSAALVRWFSENETGVVQSAFPADSELVGQALSRDSHVAQMCASGLPQVWEDASHFDVATPVFGTGEPAQRFGSLAIVPLKGERGVTGAIVIFGERPGDVRIRDVRNIHLLAAMAAVSLETQWEIEEVTRRARTDQLTGLPNRRAFDEALAPALIQAERYEQPLSLILADIDHFKRVNDTLGHAGGDAVLRSVAATLQRLVRTSDLCARFGGEEIAVLLPHTPQRGAEELAERLRAAVAGRPVRAGGRDLDVTVSFGVASLHESTTAEEGLFAAADRALYAAKAGGRNCVRSAEIVR